MNKKNKHGFINRMDDNNFLFSHQSAEVSNQNNEFIVYIFDLLGWTYIVPLVK